MARWLSPGLAAIAAATALLGAGCGDDGPEDARPSQAAGAAEAAGLGEEVQDFFALAAEGAAATYAATYSTEAAATGSEAGPGTAQLAIAQRPPDRRLEITSSDGTVALTLQRRGVTYQCQRPAAGSWSCERLSDLEPPAAVAFDPAALAATTDALREFADDYDFSVEPRTLAGTEASCLLMTLREGREDDTSLGRSATFCLSPTGVPLLIERPGERLTATAYTTTVDDSAFDLPA